MDANGREKGARDANQDANRTPAPSGRWVTVTEAAGLLGVQARAIQKRIAADRLRSMRDGRRLLVWVEESEGTAAGPDQDAQDATETRTEPERREPDASPVETGSGALVEQLRSEVEFLRGQLDARTTAEAEFRRLLAYSQERERQDRREIADLRARLALGPGEAPTESGGVAETEPQPSPTPVRSWWPWRRKK